MAKQVNGDDAAWKKKEEVDAWFNNVAGTSLGAFLNGAPGQENAMKLAELLRVAENFKEYFLDQVLDGKKAWLEWVSVFPAFIKSAQLYYDVELWHTRHALASFVYFEEFIDGTKVTIKGKVSVVRNDQGELTQWTYFSKDGSWEAAAQKIGELAQKNSQKN